MIVNKLHQIMSDNKIRNISELARETELDRRTLTAIYDGKNKGVDYVTLNKLCKHFNCSISDLLEYVPDQEGS